MFGNLRLSKLSLKSITTKQANKISQSSAQTSSSVSSEIKNYIESLKQEFAQVFLPSKDPIKDFKVHLTLKPGAIPKFLKACPVPFSLKDKVTTLFEEMESKKIIKRVKHSDWASQVVLVSKKNGDFRPCCNYKPTINLALQNEEYPLPVIDDILSSLKGYSWFVSLDLTGAYLQLALDDESQKLTAINTHLGLFIFLRLPFGVKVAPSIFQAVIDQILQGLEGVVAYFDDILIAGKTIEECFKRTQLLLKRLQEYNVQVNWDKCSFFKES